MDKSRGISERELDPTLLAKIGMGNYLQKQTLSVITTEDKQKIIPIPMENYNSKIYKFEVNIDGNIYPDYNYIIDENINSIVIKTDIIGIDINKKVNFVFHWNAYVNKTIEAPTVHVTDCNTKICTIEHNMRKYPHIQVLEVLYGAGIGDAGEYPTGMDSKMLYPRIDYVNLDSSILYLNDEYSLYLNPVLNRISEGKYVVTFDAPCVKSLLILVDKFELFRNEANFHTDSVITDIVNPVKGFVRNQMIYGKTLQNLWNTNNILPIWDNTNTKVNIENTSPLMNKITTYTVVNLSDKVIVISLYNTQTNTYVNEINVAAKGFVNITVTDITQIKLVSGKSIDGWSSENFNELSTSCIILEGDNSINKNLPKTYFSGIKSVGDDEYSISSVTDINNISDDYTKSTKTYNIKLRCIGNIRDEYNIDIDTVTRKIATVNLGYDFMDSIYYDSDNRTENYRLTLSKFCDLGDTNFPIESICDKANLLSNANFDNSDAEYVYYTGYNATTKSIDIKININKLKLTDLSHNGILSYLKNANINVLYKLQSSIQEEVSDIPITLNDDTKYIIINGNILPEVDFVYPLNIKSSVDNLVDVLNSLRDDIQKIIKHDKDISHINDSLYEIAKLKLDVAVLKSATLYDMKSNLFFIEFSTLDDVKLKTGIHDSSSSKIYV